MNSEGSYPQGTGAVPVKTRPALRPDRDLEKGGRSRSPLKYPDRHDRCTDRLATVANPAG